MLKAASNARVVSMILSNGSALTFFETETGSLHNAAGNSVTFIISELLKVMVADNDQRRADLAKYGPLQVKLEAQISAAPFDSVPQYVLDTAKKGGAKLKRVADEVATVSREIGELGQLLTFARKFDREQETKAITEAAAAQAKAQEEPEQQSQAQAQAPKFSSAALQRLMDHLFNARPATNANPGVFELGCGLPDCPGCNPNLGTEENELTGALKGAQEEALDLAAAEEPSSPADGIFNFGNAVKPKVMLVEVKPGQSLPEAISEAMGIPADQLKFGLPN